MIRLLSILLTITAISLGLAWVADEPGRVAIDWGAYHIETSILVVIAAVMFMAACFMLAYWIGYLILRSPRIWSRSRALKRQSLGLTALTETFAAIATQDIHAARKQIKRAQTLLPNQPLTLMLASQVARLEGNDSQARLYLEQMSKAEGTEFLALRGLIENARRAHDDKTALTYGEKALTIKPQNSWLILTMIGIYCRLNRTQNAVQLIEMSARKRAISREEAKRLGAYVLFENARALSEQKRIDFAIAVLEDVLRRLPAFVPATALLAQHYTTQGEIKRALKAIGNGWKIAPHPQLTDAFLLCSASEKEPKKVTAAAERMVADHPEHRQSQFLSARMALQRHEFATARRCLIFLQAQAETARVCMLIAEVEDAADDHEQAAAWLKRAAVAKAEPAWDCDNCHHMIEDWHMTCRNCGSVASLSWK